MVGMLRGLDLELLHMRLGNLGIEAMDLLCLDHWLRREDGLNLDGLVYGLICIIYEST